MRLGACCILALLVISGAAAAAAPAAFVVEGRGWGHGVGMSSGARKGSPSTAGAIAILGHYYPETKLVREGTRGIRVLLAEGEARVVVSSTAPFRVVAGRRTRLLRAGRYAVPGRTLRPPLRFEPGGAPLALDGSAYRGDLVVSGAPGALDVVDRLPLERYLRGVVPAEMPFYWRPEALAAQAVAARS